MKPQVFILHGIFRTAKHMRKLAIALEKNQFDVVNINYPSTQYPIETLLRIIAEQINPNDQPCHFVGYSLGALLWRIFLADPKYRPAKIGRVVQLAPPNNGSAVADFWQHNWLYKKLYGPAGQQLITDQSSIQHLLKPIDYELGVLAGCQNIDPFSSWILREPNDGKVTINSTLIHGIKEHRIVKANHTFFPQNNTVIDNTIHFLKHGWFIFLASDLIIGQ